MLQSQKRGGSDAVTGAGGGSRLAQQQQRQGFGGIGLVAAAAAAGMADDHGGSGEPGGATAWHQRGGLSAGVQSHAISPALTSYQPASPQT